VTVPVGAAARPEPGDDVRVAPLALRAGLWNSIRRSSHTQWPDHGRHGQRRGDDV